jgi:hypothetical protein
VTYPCSSPDGVVALACNDRKHGSRPGGQVPTSRAASLVRIESPDRSRSEIHGYRLPASRRFRRRVSKDERRPAVFEAGTPRCSPGYGFNKIC